METKTKTKNVAVFANSRQIFLDFLSENKKEKENYFHIRNIKDAFGRSYDRIETTPNCYLIENYSNIVNYIEMHLRK